MLTYLQQRVGTWALWLYAGAVCLFLVAPLGVVIAISFTASNFIQFPPEGLSLRWYADIKNARGFFPALFLSLRLAALTAIGAGILGTALALGMARRRFPGKGLITTFVLSPLIFPSIVIGIALLQFFRSIGLENVFVMLLLSHIVLTVPFTVRTVTASLQVFDYTLHEAATVLGADSIRTFIEVTLPLIRPSIVSGMIFGFIVSFDQYTVSMFLADAQNIPLPMRLFGYVEHTMSPTTAAIASSIVYLAVAFLLVGGRLIGLRRMARI